jgi:hypothetical protein
MSGSSESAALNTLLITLPGRVNSIDVIYFRCGYFGSRSSNTSKAIALNLLPYPLFGNTLVDSLDPIAIY